MGRLTPEQHAKIAAHFAEQAKQREAEHAAAPEVVAIKITYKEPAPDGTFEILFMTRAEANEYKARPSAGAFGPFEEISFAEGVALAQRNDCCGGSFSLQDARRFHQINPFVQSLKLVF